MRSRHSSAPQGPIAVQKNRLAQTGELIEQYSRLVGDSDNGDSFRVALERAIQRKLRIESWLAAHEKTPNRAESSGNFPSYKQDPPATFYNLFTSSP